MKNWHQKISNNWIEFSLLAILIILFSVAAIFLYNPLSFHESKNKQTAEDQKKKAGNKPVTNRSGQQNTSRGSEGNSEKHNSEQTKTSFPEEETGRIIVRVVDQRGNPIPNAHIDFPELPFGSGERHRKYLEKLGVKSLSRGDRQTDQNGVARIRIWLTDQIRFYAKKGRGFPIRGWKKGYETKGSVPYSTGCEMPDRGETKETTLVLKKARKISVKLINVDKNGVKYLNDNYQIELETKKDSENEKWTQEAKVNKSGTLLWEGLTKKGDSRESELVPHVWVPLEKLELKFFPRVASRSYRMYLKKVVTIKPAGSYSDPDEVHLNLRLKKNPNFQQPPPDVTLRTSLRNWPEETTDVYCRVNLWSEKKKQVVYRRGFKKETSTFEHDLHHRKPGSYRVQVSAISRSGTSAWYGITSFRVKENQDNQKIDVSIPRGEVAKVQFFHAAKNKYLSKKQFEQPKRYTRFRPRHRTYVGLAYHILNDRLYILLPPKQNKMKMDGVGAFHITVRENSNNEFKINFPGKK